MITTRESINYQFSLIFGYSSPNDIIVGNVVGPGKLTRKKVNELSQEVIKFLRMYNAILRDYTGSEVFSIEFELFNFDEKDAGINIYPKSMILVPGKFKECESLLLALKPDTGYLDTHKSRESVNSISNLFFEVEEFTERPELDSERKSQVLKKFATRFSKKLYGELIEDKWNKKLIGLTVSLPTEKEMLNSYASIKSDVEFLWNKRPYEIKFYNPQYEKKRTQFEGKIEIEHLKYIISEPSANFIVDKTLKLGANLIKLANMGTVDESQEKISLFLITRIKEKIKKINEPHTAEWLISYSRKILNELEISVDKFLEISSDFLSTGETGDLEKLLDKYHQFLIGKVKIDNDYFEELYNLARNSIEQSISQKQNLRVVELSSVLNYFSEVIRSNILLVIKSLPRYLYRRRLKTLTFELISALTEKVNKEQEPARVIGNNLLIKFRNFLINQIEINPLVLSKNITFNEESIIREFKKLLNQNLNKFFDTISLDISDLISFAEVQMEKDSKIIKTHIEAFRKFSSELGFLLSYILRYSTINRFLKDEPDSEIADPVTFASRFHRFLEKRVGGIQLVWKSYILEWIKDYAKKFFKVEEKRDWSLKETFLDFLEYFEERESKEQQTDSFLEFLDSYIAKIPENIEREHLIEFYRQFELCIDIRTEFPNYIKSKIKTGMSLLEIEIEKQPPIKYFSIDHEDSFSNYISEVDLKYFSKLIPRPVSLILQHELTSEEQELFNGELYHTFQFKYWHNKARIEMADNFKEVYREWLKEL
jgi:hypothetical protein